MPTPSFHWLRPKSWESFLTLFLSSIYHKAVFSLQNISQIRPLLPPAWPLTWSKPLPSLTWIPGIGFSHLASLCVPLPSTLDIMAASLIVLKQSYHVPPVTSLHWIPFSFRVKAQVLTITWKAPRNLGLCYFLSLALSLCLSRFPPNSLAPKLMVKYTGYSPP